MTARASIVGAGREAWAALVLATLCAPAAGSAHAGSGLALSTLALSTLALSTSALTAAQTETAQTETAQTETVQTETVQTATAQSGTAQSETPRNAKAQSPAAPSEAAQNGAAPSQVDASTAPAVIAPRATTTPAGTPTTPDSGVADGARAATEVEIFVRCLERVRRGDDEAIAPLRASADRRAREEDRPDARAVAEFFATMPRADRLRGWALEERWLAQRTAVRDAAKARLDTEAWRPLRAKILSELSEIVRESESGPDVTPAARALSLAAYLRSERVSTDRTLAPEERRSWIEAGLAEATRALELFERAGMGVPRLEPLEALAEIELAREHRDEAADYFAEMRSEGRRLGQRAYEAKGLVGLARLAQEAGDLSEAGAILSELSRLVSPSEDWELAKRQGQYLLAIDEPTRAAEFLAAHRPRAHSASTEWHVLMVGALIRKGDAASAAAHVAALSADPNDRTLAALARADAALHAADTATAEAALAEVTDPRASSPRLYADHQRLEGRLRLAQGRAQDAIACFERALATGDSLEARLGAQGASPTASVVGESIGLETVALLASALAAEGRALDAAVCIEDRQSRALRTAVLRADREVASADEPALARTERTSDVAPRVTPDVLRSWAASYEQGLVTWVVGADTSVVVHVARDGEARAATIPHGRAEVFEAVRRLREAALVGDEARARALATEIEAALLTPHLLARLDANPSADEGRVLLLTHGPIEDLPFALLPAFADVAARRLVPVCLPGLPEPVRGAAPTREAFASWSVLGDPVDASGRSLLPGASREIDTVAERASASFVRSGAAFDAAALRTALDSSRCLHLATHLRLEPHSTAPRDAFGGARYAEAAFELSNGARFDVAEVRRAAPRLPLAVLAACETGSGQFVDAQASLGLVRAFLESGTRNLIVTAWPVEDGAAQRFAIAFHQALAKGKSPSRAAVFAREKLRESGASPADWAAFALVGRD